MKPHHWCPHSGGPGISTLGGGGGISARAHTCHPSETCSPAASSHCLRSGRGAWPNSRTQKAFGSQTSRGASPREGVWGGFSKDCLRLRTWLRPWLCHELAENLVSAATAASIHQVSTVCLAVPGALEMPVPGPHPDHLSHHLWGGTWASSLSRAPRVSPTCSQG